jgi:hypothetical protein
VDKVQDDGDVGLAAGGFGLDGLDLGGVAIDEGDPGPVVAGVAAVGFVEGGGDDGRDVVGDAGGQPLASSVRPRPCRYEVGRAGR